MKRPALTAKAIEGLRSVRWEAHCMVSEREGCEDTSSAGKGGKDERTWRGIEYIDALIDWWEAQQEGSNR